MWLLTHGWPSFGLHSLMGINLSDSLLRVVLNRFHLLLTGMLLDVLK